MNYKEALLLTRHKMNVGMYVYVYVCEYVCVCVLCRSTYKLHFYFNSIPHTHNIVQNYYTHTNTNTQTHTHITKELVSDLAAKVQYQFRLENIKIGYNKKNSFFLCLYKFPFNRIN